MGRGPVLFCWQMKKALLLQNLECGNADVKVQDKFCVLHF